MCHLGVLTAQMPISCVWCSGNLLYWVLVPLEFDLHPVPSIASTSSSFRLRPSGYQGISLTK